MFFPNVAWKVSVRSAAYIPATLERMKKVFAGLAVLLVVFGGLAFSQAAPGRIAFITLGGQVATVEPDGSGLRVLTSGAQSFQFPAWSPNGSRLAVLGADAEGGFLTVLEDAEDAVPRELYRSLDEPPFYLYWAPDAGTIGFLASHAEAGIGLHLASTTGVGSSRLLATGSPFYWQWTSDGQGLFIHANGSGETARLGFTSRVRDTLDTNLASPGNFQAPGISPSGRYIAYAAIEPSRGARLVIEGRPGSDVDVEREVAFDGFASLTWSPVADELAFMSSPGAAPIVFGPIKLLDAGSGLLEPLTDRPALAFFWSPDGRYLAYFTPHRASGGELAGTTETTMIAQRAQGRPLLLDLYLIDVEAKTERLLTTFAPSPQFVVQFLPFFSQYALSHSLWSPKSDALVLPVIDLEMPTLRVVVIGLDGTVTPVGEGDMAFWSR